MQPVFIDGETVERVLTMAACIEVMDRAMRAASAGTVVAPMRLMAPLADDSGLLVLMPGSSLAPAVYGAKIVGLHPGNPARGLPPIQGFVVLFDHATGNPLAIVDGGSVTAIRTAAASALATRELARANASTHGIFGTGVQAVTHIDAISAVRRIGRILVWGRDAERTRRFAAEQSARTGFHIEACTDPTQVAACDIVSTVTGASEPILHGEWLKAGAHVNLVGAHTRRTREADSDAVVEASVYVDLLESAHNESGNILIPIEEGRMTASDIVGEIGQLLNGDIKGRRDDKQMTLYVSLGCVAQDLFAAEYVLRNYAATDTPLPQ